MNEREIKAMISLLDDPDLEIFTQIEQELITLGPEIIPQLEENWEHTFDPLSQSRIENIIHTIQFDQIKYDLTNWNNESSKNLLEGLLIINRYQYPNLDEINVTHEIYKLRENAWFQLMYDMSPLEKVKLLNNILFREFGLSGNTTNYHDPQNSFIHKILETKKGNPLTLSCIYIIVAQQLDIPIYGINLPKHFVIAYMEEMDKPPLFYINAFNRGQIMHENDIYSFLKQLNLPPIDEYTMPCTNKAIIKRVLRNLITAYENIGNPQKKEEINTLLKILKD